MNSLTWLHLSDLHACSPKSGWDARDVLETLLKDLRHMQKCEGLNPDLIFFTGDFSFGHIGNAKGEKLSDQFHEIHNFLEEVRSSFDIKVPREKMFFVPGNHDINRKATTLALSSWLDQQTSGDPIIDMIQKADVQWQHFMERLREYRSFLQSKGYNHLLEDPERLIYAIICNLKGTKVGIAGFNSSWSCSRDKEIGKLWLGGKWQVGHLWPKIESANITVALTHHPPNWFVESENPSFGRLIASKFRFYLHGHEHLGWVEPKHNGHTRISATACYNRSDKENGYNFVRLNLETGKGEVWLRKYDPQGLGWIPNIVAGSTNNDGMWPLDHLDWLKTGIQLRGGKTTKSKCEIETSQPTLRLNFYHLIFKHTYLFAGRKVELNKIFRFIKAKKSGYIFIQALAGHGKTSLLAKLVRDNPQFAYHFISQIYKTSGSDFDPTQMDSLLSNLCEQLLPVEAYLDAGTSLRAKFIRFVESYPTKGQQIIVIDAVDEVDSYPNYLLGLLPAVLPTGMFIIISARKLGERDYLSEIGLEAKNIGLRIELLGLNKQDISELLSMAKGHASPLAESDSFVKALYSVSNGDPFYLRFLVEDVAEGLITSGNIGQVPSGLNDYLDTQLSVLDRSAHLQQQRDILGLIVEAHGPLSRRDLINMVDGLDGLNFDNVIRDIQRFLLSYNDTFRFCHIRFKEYLASKIQ